MLRGLLQQKLPVPDVEVIERKQWPLVHVSGKTAPVSCPARPKTTQRYVWADIVEAKKARLLAGGELVVSLVTLRDGTSYLFDGHHAWAAYKALGRTPRCVRYGPGPDFIAAPKLFRR